MHSQDGRNGIKQCLEVVIKTDFFLSPERWKMTAMMNWGKGYNTKKKLQLHFLVAVYTVKAITSTSGN